MPKILVVEDSINIREEIWTVSYRKERNKKEKWSKK